MNANFPRPKPVAALGPPIHGRDLLLVIAVGLGVFWAASTLLQAVAAGATEPGARINYLIGYYGAWAFAWLAAIWIVLVRRRGTTFSDIGYTVPEPKWAARGVLAGFIALPAAFILYMLLRPVLGTQSSTDLRAYFGGDAFNGIHAVTILLYAGFLVPIAEELLFRGLLFRWLRQRLDFWPAALIGAAVFGIAHQRADQMVIAGLLGLPLAWLTEKSRSLAPAILMHQTYNSLTLMVTFAAVWFQPEAQS